MRKVSEHDSPIWYDDQGSFIADLDSPRQTPQLDLNNNNYQHSYPCKRELDLHYSIPHGHFLQLPLLESPKLLQTAPAMSCNSMAAYGLSSLTQEENIQQIHEQNLNSIFGSNSGEQAVDQVTDWRVLDKFVASQLSQEDGSKETEYPNAGNMFVQQLNKQEMTMENASTSNSSCQMDLWKWSHTG